VKNTDVVEIDTVLNQINILKSNHHAGVEKYAKIIISQQKKRVRYEALANYCFQKITCITQYENGKRKSHECKSSTPKCPGIKVRHCNVRYIKGGCRKSYCCENTFKEGRKISHNCKVNRVVCPRSLRKKCHFFKTRGGCKRQKCCLFRFRGLKMIKKNADLIE